jgi:putative ABC transport system permease protein
VGAEPLRPVEELAGPVVQIRVSGVFEPRDPAGAVWQLDSRLLRAGVRHWPYFDLDVPLQQGTLVTDQAGIYSLLDRGLNELLEIENVGRVRLDERRLEADWPGPARDAVSAVLASPAQRPDLLVETGLIGLLEEYERQAAAARAVTAVVAAGLVGTGIGLLLLAARVTVDRRRGEQALLRARGGSLATVVGRFLREAALVLVPAVPVGWLLHRLLPGRPDPGLLGVGVVPLAVGMLVLLAVPAMVAAAGAGSGGGSGRRDLTRYRSAPVRLTVELLVVLLAGLGVLLLHQRGLTGTSAGSTGPAAADPFLSAVPVLLGVAAGLVALRLYPWPLRLLGAMAARRRGAVSFLGLARAGRAAPATALPLLVLVLAVAVGGFAGAVYGSVAAARDAATVRAVGADYRVAAAGTTDAVVAEVGALPGVETVAVAGQSGFVQLDGRPIQNVFVVTVDAPAYQRVLVAVGAPSRLPDRFVSARPGSGPLPVLGPPPEPDREFAIEVAGVAYPAEVIGGVGELPELAGGTWVLVPRQALAEPPPVDELLVAGPDADPAAVRAVVGEAAGVDPEAVVVTSLAGERAELESSGFNRTLTLVFAVGTAGAAFGGLLAVGLAVAVQAAARGRALSLLRTMGLSARQARGLLLVELVPVAALAVAVGAAAGTAMPLLLAPALGLTEFTGGAPLSLALDPTTALLLAGLLAVFVVGGTVVEAATNRRLGLGQVLRVDSATR